jgi:hypothetical protein
MAVVYGDENGRPNRLIAGSAPPHAPGPGDEIIPFHIQPNTSVRVVLKRSPSLRLCYTHFSR